MSSIVIFDPFSPVVVNRVTSYQQYVNTPDYQDRTDALINPDLSGVSGISQNYWQVTDSTVYGMSELDMTAVNNFLLAKTGRQKKYHVVIYNSTNHMQQETWFDTSLGQGQYDGTAETTSYVYDGQNLTSMVITDYCYDGTPRTVETHNYYKNDQGQIIEKIE